MIAEEAWFVMEFAVLAAAAAVLALFGLGWLSYRRVQGDRQAFHRLPAPERELIVKALLFVVHHGAIEKGQAAAGRIRRPAQVLGELLTLRAHTVDEALRTLIGYGYLNGVLGPSIWSLTTHIETTPRGRGFHERHFGSSGGVFDLPSLGLVVLSGQSPRFPSLPPTSDVLALPRTDDRAR